MQCVKIGVVLKGIGIVSLLTVTLCAGAAPIIDNDRVTVWDLTWSQDQPGAAMQHDRDFVTIYLAGSTDKSHAKGDVRFAHGGVSRLNPGERTIVIELKDKPVTPLVNKSGYPLAFPRPHVKKVLENDRILVWSYRWNPGEPTPMHFHDKDVVVVYMEPTALKSTTPDGKSTLNEYSALETRFNLRDRTHTELLVRGTGSAIITELK